MDLYRFWAGKNGPWDEIKNLTEIKLHALRRLAKVVCRYLITGSVLKL